MRSSPPREWVLGPLQPSNVWEAVPATTAPSHCHYRTILSPQGPRRHHVQPRQRPPAEAPAVPVSIRCRKSTVWSQLGGRNLGAFPPGVARIQPDLQPSGSCRYPRVMAEEGLRVVRQWLEASSQLEEGEGSWRLGPARPALPVVDTGVSVPSQPPSTAAGRWRRTGVCPCCAPTRQSMDPTSPGVWVRGQARVGREPAGCATGLSSASSLSAGEDMKAEGRQQLALFLVSGLLWTNRMRQESLHMGLPGWR